MVGVAVKVIDWPLQIVLPALDTMVSDGTPFALIAMVIALEVAVVGEAQGEFEVSPQVIASLLAKDEDEYVDEVAPPIAEPFLYH